ncbi:MAG: hypothetical protein WKF40_06030 [Thermoleophilaceae bacterium]
MVALEELREGRWRDLMPIRPRTDGTGVQSTGPILLRDGRAACPRAPGCACGATAW